MNAYGNDQIAAVRAAIGAQDIVRGGGTAATFDSTDALTALSFAASTTYKFRMPVGGAGGLDCTLTLDSHTGTVPTAKLYATFSDGSTQKGTAVSFAALTDDTAKTASITIGDGTRTRFVVLEIAVPATSTAVFSFAEWAAL